ncbi:hypothetical protein [Actinomarinicola tropica]|uniref:Uncharacterized protein n=1 Tax=Actinomarinicola tropica TaxID=2789776 RepID=A0A5Q2RMN5_9ACTN|nr:hypothetical protein [Actinomarinicola tropica]QGG94445.1 hypothetical protein GH723_04620 [Actinomarinicola tropica]
MTTLASRADALLAGAVYDLGSGRVRLIDTSAVHPNPSPAGSTPTGDPTP